MRGILGYGAYIPHHRLSRAAIAHTLGSGSARGSRAVAGYDEDTTSMGVEAARIALGGTAPRGDVGALLFATSAPAYQDKTNATAIHAALLLNEQALAVDLGTSVNAGTSAILMALQTSRPGLSALAVTAEVRTGQPGSTDEGTAGDAAAAFLVGSAQEGPILAEFLGHGQATVEVLERWRTPGQSFSRVWEERFAEQVYVPLVVAAFTDALKSAGLTQDAVDDLIVVGMHERTVSRVPAALGVPPEAVVSTRNEVLGNAGAAQAGRVLADRLDRAGPGRIIALVAIGDGVSVLIFRTTDELLQKREQATAVRSVETQTRHQADLAYATFLSWRGFLDREPPRRPAPEPTYAPPAWRRRRWKFGFVAARCAECGTRHLPPSVVCTSCAGDRMVDEPMADVPARIATFTVDRLAATPSPPMLIAVLDFDGGGRFRCELTDAAPEEAAVGMPVEMTFRKTVTAAGVHNYFWKARPVRGET